MKGPSLDAHLVELAEPASCGRLVLIHSNLATLRESEPRHGGPAP